MSDTYTESFTSQDTEGWPIYLSMKKNNPYFYNKTGILGTLGLQAGTWHLTGVLY